MHEALIIILLIAIALDMAMLMFAITRQDRTRSIYFAVLTAALFLYLFGYLLEVMSDTSEAIMVAIKVENAGIPLIAPFFLLMIVSLFHTKRLRPWMLPAGVIYGAVMFLCVLFNDYHHLFYSSIELVQREGGHFAKLGHGPLYYMQQAITTILMVLAYVAIFSRFFTGGKKLRGQMHYIIFGSLVAFMASFLNVLGIMPAGIDFAPLSVTLALVFVSVSMFRNRLMDIVTMSSTLAIETMDDSMIVLDNDWCFVLCNRSAELLFPPLKEFQGTEAITALQDWPPELAPGQQAGQVTFQREVDGVAATYRAHISKITAGAGQMTGWSIVIRDISDTTLLLERLEELASTDALTGILNRRQFLVVVEREFGRANRQHLSMGLIMFDIDHFKGINDTYGHTAGDYVLCAVVNTIRTQLRAYDTFARYGGEEFVIFTTDREKNGLFAFATRLREAVTDADIVFEGTKISVTASFGAIYVPLEASLDKAIRMADDAMYQAKAAGRNCVFIAE